MDLCKAAQKMWNDYVIARTPESLARALDQLAEDAIVIGTGKHEFYLDRKGMAQALEKELATTTDQKFVIVDEWYQEQVLSDTVRIVYGGLRVRDAELGQPALVDMDSRFTLVYTLTGGAWKIRHAHQSLPYRDQAPDEYYPRSLAEQVQEARLLADRMTRLAETDPVTGLYNHRAFFKAADDRLAQGPAYFMVLDLDDFKRVNDTYGHLTGDSVLACTGEVLRAATRSVDVVGRIGGDEFAVLCPGVTGDEAALAIARRIIDHVNAKAGSKVGCTVRLSIGIARGEKGVRAQELFRLADLALYRVKGNGKNGCCLYDPAVDGVPGPAPL